MPDSWPDLECFVQPMRNSSLLAIFAVLAIASLGIKAVAGPPRDGLIDRHPGEFEQIVSASLERQHFSTRVQRFRFRSALVLALRGGCRLAVRDARVPDGFEAIFAQDASSIGPVRYLFNGSSYSYPPQLAPRLVRLKTEVLHRLGWNETSPPLIAMASSPSCGASDFGMKDVRVST